MRSEPAVPEGIRSLVDEVRASRLPSPATCRRIREEADVSIRAAAAAIDVNPLTIIRWELGRVKPRRESARKWRLLLDALKEATPGA